MSLFLIVTWYYFSFPPSIPLYFTGNAGSHIAHHVVELFFFDARRNQIFAASANGPFRLGIGAPELTSRANIHTRAAEATHFRLDVKRRSDAPVFAPSAKADCLGHHLFLTHPHAQPTKDAVLMLLLEPLLAYPMGRS